MKTILSSLILIPSIAAGFAPYQSSFTGSASSVCSRAELTTGLSCPPSSSSLNKYRGRNMGMPPFLKKLGLKKPEKTIFDGEDSNGGNTVLLEKKEENLSVEANMIEEEEEEELSETQKLLKQVKEAGTAGVISYALWELAFWALSVPVCIFGYYELVGHMPDLSNKEDLSKLGGEAFAFVNFARFAVPLRIGLALSTTSWIQENVVEKFMKKEDDE